MAQLLLPPRGNGNEELARRLLDRLPGAVALYASECAVPCNGRTILAPDAGTDAAVLDRVAELVKWPQGEPLTAAGLYAARVLLGFGCCRHNLRRAVATGCLYDPYESCLRGLGDGGVYGLENIVRACVDVVLNIGAAAAGSVDWYRQFREYLIRNLYRYEPGGDWPWLLSDAVAAAYIDSRIGTSVGADDDYVSQLADEKLAKFRSLYAWARAPAPEPELPAPFDGGSNRAELAVVSAPDFDAAEAVRLAGVYAFKGAWPAGSGGSGFPVKWYDVAREAEMTPEQRVEQIVKENENWFRTTMPDGPQKECVINFTAKLAALLRAWRERWRGQPKLTFTLGHRPERTAESLPDADLAPSGVDLDLPLPLVYSEEHRSGRSDPCPFCGEFCKWQRCVPVPYVVYRDEKNRRRTKCVEMYRLVHACPKAPPHCRNAKSVIVPTVANIFMQLYNDVRRRYLHVSEVAFLLKMFRHQLASGDGNAQNSLAALRRFLNREIARADGRLNRTGETLQLRLRWDSDGQLWEALQWGIKTIQQIASERSCSEAQFSPSSGPVLEASTPVSVPVILSSG